MARMCSPLRYPGGKAVLGRFLAEVVDCNGLHGGRYYEPYAGGAGAALDLLTQGHVSEIFINDADYAVASFWTAVTTQNARFLDTLAAAPITVDEWRRQKAIYRQGKKAAPFSLGFAAFFLNRTSRSGILTKSGPIGGYDQAGPYKLDARLNKAAMANRLAVLADHKNAIHVFNSDAIAFLKAALPPRASADRRKVLVYLDPPYYAQGSRLYLNYYQPRDHAVLARYMAAQHVLPWLMSYDNTPEIRALYPQCDTFEFSLNHSTQNTRRDPELLIVPGHVALPVHIELYGEKIPLPRKAA